ncbi:hypothetical protein JAAARDRAFT_132476 [Jaapia argillacea MUCL 33604]|uniref:intramembrane prenyl-peptidase Rce1 n=1 Tax=Jaapia argillacea MUCL 33604 TaxID=933084 RepID=A0A067Q0Y6_9AGAM|nr:hypothetical protein JAAARDRAFT_132476 [Jaapia argillacea MUCL 33604]
MFISYYGPIMTARAAHTFAALFTFLYVGSLYAVKNARLSFAAKTVRVPNGGPRVKERDERWRDDPDVIKARLTVASLVTLACCALVYFVVFTPLAREHEVSFFTFESTIIRLGLGLEGPHTVYPYLVAPMLFFGPLYALSLAQMLPFQRCFVFRRDVIGVLFSWQGFRNFVVGPITEELVFRSCILAIYKMNGASEAAMIFVAPLWFGAAHLHHAWDCFNRYGRTWAAARRAILMTIFQSVYTTLFGAHSAFLFLRTGSVYPPIVSHIFCNIMGVPQMGEELKRFPRNKRGIKIAYVVGVLGYIYALGAWTRTDDSFYWRPYYETPKF